jgi:Fic family protein
VSGAIHDPTVHFEAPPSGRVSKEMRRYLTWFNDTTPNTRKNLPALTRAGIAHLHFESIHPFEDGNGRVGRALAEKVLAQGLGQPSLTALATTMLNHRGEYYQALEAANKNNEITAWLTWFAGISLEAQQRSLAQVEFVLDKARLLDRFRSDLNDRQLRVLLRVLREGPEGFKGGLSAGNYMTISKASPATTTRDLANMVERGALTRTGEKRHTRYHLPIPLRPTPRIRIDEHGGIVTMPSP